MGQSQLVTKPEQAKKSTFLPHAVITETRKSKVLRCKEILKALEKGKHSYYRQEIIQFLRHCSGIKEKWKQSQLGSQGGERMINTQETAGKKNPLPVKCKTAQRL